MQIEVITIGNEVLSGRTLDTNFAWLARALEAVSVQVGWHSTVPDLEERIVEALRLALARADAVVTTGGLGPTPDDLTRAAVAKALGVPLVRDEAVLEAIRERLRRMKRLLPASVEVQAMLPQGAEALPNALGTAPGIRLLANGRPLYLLPGVPHEMEALAARFVVPQLAAASGRTVASVTLRTAGVVETRLHEAIGDLPDEWPGATLAYLPGWSGVDLRVTVAGDDPAAVGATAVRARAALEALVGAVVYADGDRTMEEVVGEALAARGWKLAVAESCTGGLVAKRVTDVPGSSGWFERGFITYSNRSKVELLGVREQDLIEHGAVSPPVAEQMARGACQRAAVEVGVGVTGIAGPEGGSEEKPVGTVFVSIATPGGVHTRRLFLPGPRRAVRERATQTALDMVRRAVLGLPLEPQLGP